MSKISNSPHTGIDAPILSSEAGGFFSGAGDAEFTNGESGFKVAFRFDGRLLLTGSMPPIWPNTPMRSISAVTADG